jgi:uncharacterized protein YbbC (DUF1343 family)
MKIIILLLIIMAFGCQKKDTSIDQNPEKFNKSPLLLGIDNFLAYHTHLVSGKRTGLLTNQSGVNYAFESTIDILHSNPTVHLSALFAPEHGIRGKVYAGEEVESIKYNQYNLPVYSVYRINQQSLNETVKKMDVIIIDIQDIGIRPYTYIYAMAKLMRAAAENSKLIIVLDRPNPISGMYPEGNLIREGFFSEVGLFPIPYRHGMTIGELALLFNHQYGIGAELKVIPMKGWERSMFWQETGLQWIPTSPHVPSCETILYLCITGMIGELHTLSNGVGYTTPFMLIGAPWMDAHLLSRQLNNLELNGIRFRPIYFKPFYALYKGLVCRGVQLHITDLHQIRPFRCCLHIIQSVMRLYPDHELFSNKKNVEMFNKVIGTDEIISKLKKGFAIEQIEKSWQEELNNFLIIRKKYLLY